MPSGSARQSYVIIDFPNSTSLPFLQPWGVQSNRSSGYGGLQWMQLQSGMDVPGRRPPNPPPREYLTKLRDLLAAWLLSTVLDSVADPTDPNWCTSVIWSSPLTCDVHTIL